MSRSASQRRTMLRPLPSIFTLLMLVVAILCVQRPVARGADVVGHIDVAIASNAKIDPQYTASHEQVVILQAWETAEARAIKAANPRVKVLMYENASSASTAASASGIYATGVSEPEAAAHGWLLRDTGGARFTFEGEPWLYAADIGSRGYARAWAHNVLGYLHGGPWDGVFIDDLNPTIRYHDDPSTVAKYPSDQRYGAAMGRFVRTVGPSIRASGKLAIANIGSWSAYPRVADSWLRSLSGAMDEQFTKWGVSPRTGYVDQSTWTTQLHELVLTQSERKLFIGIAHSSRGDRHAALFGYATELLAGRGQAIFSMNANYDSAPWFSPYAYRIGVPVGHYWATSAGVFGRDFTQGVALVNPTGHTVVVKLAHRYRGCGLSGARHVTMAPHSGLVLVRAGA